MRALRGEEEGKQKTILFNLSGHGYLDLQAYADYREGKLFDHEHPEKTSKKALEAAEDISTLNSYLTLPPAGGNHSSLM
jgi:tryptophan synthase beta chain